MLSVVHMELLNNWSLFSFYINELILKLQLFMCVDGMLKLDTLLALCNMTYHLLGRK